MTTTRNDPLTDDEDDFGEFDFSQPPEDMGPDDEPHGGPGAAEWNAAASAEKPPEMPPIARAIAHAISLRAECEECSGPAHPDGTECPEEERASLLARLRSERCGTLEAMAIEQRLETLADGNREEP